MLGAKYHHHSYDKIDGLDFQIVVEADFLVNIFEQNHHDVAALRAIKENYFKTATGKEYLESMYLAGE